MKQRKYTGDWRKTPYLQYEKSKDCYCIYCGALAKTREHIPSRVLLDEPYPENLYTLPACYECNNSFSHDEVYVASVIEILSRIIIPKYKRRIGIDKSLEKNPQLKYKIEDEIIYRIEQGLDYKLDINRLDNILLKLAKGHAAFELSEYNFDKYEISIQTFSRDQVSIKEWDRFNGIEELEYSNEIGSRSIDNIYVIENNHESIIVIDWNVVQEKRYKYLAMIINGEIVIKIVINEYFAAIVTWSV